MAKQLVTVHAAKILLYLCVNSLYTFLVSVMGKNKA